MLPVSTSQYSHHPFGIVHPVGMAVQPGNHAINNNEPSPNVGGTGGVNTAAAAAALIGAQMHRNAPSGPLTIQTNTSGQLSMKKPRRRRTAFTQSQLNYLEKRFDQQKYLSVADRGQVAETLQLTETQIKTWYQNRR